MIRVVYDGEIWEAKIALRENLFIEVRELDPTRLVEITKKHRGCKVVQMKELQLECEARLN